ncbi:Ig-like domain-containing protein [Hespellia stercorisuis]|uniref:Ig-like domain (Group 2) n=1 Tax=Hespellia stercorisuis DSM 15480 TaxID=1121950 RepID=A0A1M6WYC0_9FIRM|nr:Ig-like domain-containing protein [Hespellia stercorisuis]SHK98589.1 Ig-like domain (group 2) [Hespellia stercorisuis DSM 15480]
MTKIVELKYNPFLPQLSILIDGKQPQDFSGLIQYTDEDIWEWSPNICDVIYSELRAEFAIIFTGTREDAELLKIQCTKNYHCIGFKMQEPKVRTSTQKRLGELNQIIKKNRESITPINIRAYFLTQSSTQKYIEEIRKVNVRNLFCVIDIIPIIEKSQFKNDENSFLFFIVESMESAKKLADSYYCKNPMYIICMGEKTRLREVDNHGYFYESIPQDLISSVFECFLGQPLLKAMRYCLDNISVRLRNKEETRKAILIDPLINIKFNEELEVGKSNEIVINAEPPISPLPKVDFRVLDLGIATTDGICVFGKQSGNTVLEAYQYGEKKPFKTFNIHVVKRNRIKKLILEDNELAIGITDCKCMKVDYSPVDADNVKQLTWTSSDSRVATVDKMGRVMGRESGTCKIICTAENVSSTCICTVKPYLQEIKIDMPTNQDGELEMEPTQEILLNIKLVPEDCIDKTLKIGSSDYDIVNVVNNRLIAKNKGTAIVNIQNFPKRKEVKLTVQVGKKKKGFFKALFG